MNPYNWQSHNPTVQIPREGVEKAAQLMRNNGSAIVMGGRGMGKSVFLHQLKRRLEQDSETRVLLIEAPPAALTVEACLDFLAQELDVAPNAFSSRRLFDEYFARDDTPERLVLLFDEFDRYAERGTSTQPPGRAFCNDLEAARRSLPRLSLLAAGSVGVYVVRDVLGSSFLSRALFLPLRPFPRQDASVLIQPFEHQRRAPSEDVVDALFLASGGIPALLTYGLQEIWGLDRDPNTDDVTVIYKNFQQQYREYLRDLLSALADPRLSDAPHRIWQRIQQEPGRVERSRLKAALGPASGALNLNLDDALYLLEVAGVLRIEGSNKNPVDARPIASLLNLAREGSPEGELVEQFLDDLGWLLGRLHHTSIDFFRPGRKQPQLVPESVFAAHLALGFELLGWRTEREAQRAAGRTDLLLRRNGDNETMIVELKIWGRNDYKVAHQQVESYWTDDVVTGAVVQLTEASPADWPAKYQDECLEGLSVQRRPVADRSPVQACFKVKTTLGGPEAVIHHFLLALPRRS